MSNFRHLANNVEIVCHGSLRYKHTIFSGLRHVLQPPIRNSRVSTKRRLISFLTLESRVSFLIESLGGGLGTLYADFDRGAYFTIRCVCVYVVCAIIMCVFQPPPRNQLRYRIRRLSGL